MRPFNSSNLHFLMCVAHMPAVSCLLTVSLWVLFSLKLLRYSRCILDIRRYNHIPVASSVFFSSVKKLSNCDIKDRPLHNRTPLFCLFQTTFVFITSYFTQLPRSIKREQTGREINTGCGKRFSVFSFF